MISANSIVSPILKKYMQAFGNTPIYDIIIRGLLKSLVTINYFQQSEKVFYKDYSEGKFILL